MDLLQNAGYELIPAPPSQGTSISGSGTANTWSSWVQLTASLANDSYLMGAAITAGLITRATPSYIDVQVGTGSAGNESPVSTIPVPVNLDTAAPQGLQTIIMLPTPVFLTAGSRISGRTGDDATGTRSHKLALIVAQAANVISGGEMAKTRSVLAQGSPAANTVTDLYTASGGQGVGAVQISNSNLTPVTVSVSFAPGGAADAQSQYLFSNVAIGSSQSITLPLGITPASSDKVRVKASATGVSFTLFSS